MTQQERRSNELAQLIAQHRVVRVEHLSGPITCTARKDIPQYRIKAGEMFTLYPSNYDGFAYIVCESVDGRTCGCKHHEFKHNCKHVDAENKRAVARYRARKTSELSWAEQQRAARAAMTADERAEQLLALGARRWMAA